MKVKCRYCDKEYAQYSRWWYKHRARKHPDCVEELSARRMERLLLRQYREMIRHTAALQALGGLGRHDNRPIQFATYRQQDQFNGPMTPLPGTKLTGPKQSRTITDYDPTALTMKALSEGYNPSAEVKK